MIKTGYDLPIEEVVLQYQKLSGQCGMPVGLCDRILDVIGSLSGLRVLDVGCGEATLLRKILSFQDCLGEPTKSISSRLIFEITSRFRVTPWMS
jgi:hypothetical protein